ncbi:MAG TPA: zinc ribbon domain-containing protein [Solirubrobacterales bacterium]|nr:zinc ribbon domain-containing protein [Solirubrobacterales bacterium]
MATAIFGISNNGLNLVVNLLILMLVVVWLALIVYTYLDAKRRISDPFLVGCATLASFIPYLGTAIYAIVRPPEFLEDAHERELEIKAAELRVRQLTEHSCPGCGFPIEKNFLRCPECQRRLKDPCPSCSRPVDPAWALCPYCETPLSGPERPRRKRPDDRKRPPEERQSPRRKEERAKRPEPAARRESTAPPRDPTAAREEPQREAPKEPSKPKRQQRSPSREPDPDPRQA